MCSVLIGALLNIVLDPIFIFWLDMGVKGAALATILSQACSAIWVLSFLSQTCLLAFGKAVYETGPKNRTLDVRFGNFSVHHGQYGESGGFRLE